ncbi:MAG: trypsin-like peptidase domain-containing protein [Crocinitomicaceae bacterium]|nr:trypsin-like peptidase domain-containing protein [Crocinitomicaceae bacterium]
MALLHPQSIDAVVAIGINIDSTRKKWIGTGFLYGVFNGTQNGDIKFYNIYLVTNKHVLKNLESIILKFNPHSDQASKDFQLNLKNEGKETWRGHTNPEIDVAVTQINIKLIEDAGMKFTFIKNDETAFTIPQLKEMEISEGNGIFALGFPMGLIDTDRQYVIVREGCIARIRDIYESRKKDFLCNILVFPGNSGGPIFIKPEVTALKGTKPNNKSGLIGMVKSYIPYQDVAISSQTNRPRITFEENSGLTAIEQVDHINETIEQFQKSKLI